VHDIAVFSGPKSIKLAEQALSYYSETLPDTINLFLVSPRAVLAPASSRWTNVIDNDIAGYDQVYDFLAANADVLKSFGKSPTWYLQQYLKLAFCTHMRKERIFIADGDTIFSFRLLDAMIRKPFIMTTKEVAPAYDILIRQIGLTPPPVSCVANGGLFISEYIASLNTPDSFIEIMRNLVLASSLKSDFSEYQIVGAASWDHLDKQPLKIFRRFDLINSAPVFPSKKLSSALQVYDAIAVETGHNQTIFRKIAAYFLFALGYSW
jgi:hypothetical protein